jgi:excisionase family DNA binding protein
MLGTSRATIYAGLRSGKIPSRRIGKKFIIPRAAIEEWLKSACHESKQVNDLTTDQT